MGSNQSGSARVAQRKRVVVQLDVQSFGSMFIRLLTIELPIEVKCESIAETKRILLGHFRQPKFDTISLLVRNYSIAFAPTSFVVVETSSSQQP